MDGGVLFDTEPPSLNLGTCQDLEFVEGIEASPMSLPYVTPRIKSRVCVNKAKSGRGIPRKVEKACRKKKGLIMDSNGVALAEVLDVDIGSKGRETMFL